MLSKSFPQFLIIASMAQALTMPSNGNEVHEKVSTKMSRDVAVTAITNNDQCEVQNTIDGATTLNQAFCGCGMQLQPEDVANGIDQIAAQLDSDPADPKPVQPGKAFFAKISNIVVFACNKGSGVPEVLTGAQMRQYMENTAVCCGNNTAGSWKRQVKTDGG